MQKMSQNLNYKASIEHDMFTHAEQLSFLDHYKIESIEYESKDSRVYKLSSNGVTCLLQVISKDTYMHDTIYTWETENYKYRILTKDE